MKLQNFGQFFFLLELSESMYHLLTWAGILLELTVARGGLEGVLLLTATAGLTGEPLSVNL